jgi:hypothetical protein
MNPASGNAVGRWAGEDSGERLKRAGNPEISSLRVEIRHEDELRGGLQVGLARQEMLGVLAQPGRGRGQVRVRLAASRSKKATDEDLMAKFSCK